MEYIYIYFFLVIVVSVNFFIHNIHNLMPRGPIAAAMALVLSILVTKLIVEVDKGI